MSLWNRKESESVPSFSDLFHSKCKLISYLPTMNIYCVYDAKSKTVKLSFFFSFSCFSIFDFCCCFVCQIVILIIFNGVLNHILSPFLISTLHESGSKKTSWLETIYKCITKIYPVNTIWSDLLCLTPISAISWRPVLVVEEAGVPGENHRPLAAVSQVHPFL